MGFIFTPLLIIVAGTGFYFYSRKDQRSEKIREFMNKYDALLRLLTYKRKAEIRRARSNSLSVLVRIKKDRHHLTLSEVDDRLIIVWKLESPELGRRGKEWSFNPAYSQNRMYEEVLNDIRNYQQTLQLQKRLHENQTQTA